MRPTLRTLLLVGVLAGAATLVVERAPAYAQVEDDLAEADRRFEDGDFKKSASAYDRAIRKAPNQVPPEAYSKRASIYVISKDFEGGLAFIRDKAKAAHPNAPEILEQEAVILWGLGKKGDAITAAEAAASKKQSAWIAQRMLGEYHSSRDPQKTVNAYEAYLQYRPADQEKSDVMPRIRLGFAYLSVASGLARGDKADDAGKTYQKAVAQFELLKRKFAKEPNAAANADNGLCAAYAGLGNNDRAITICEQIVRNPKQVDKGGSVWFNLGKAYLAKKQATRARAAATEYNKLNKNKNAKGFILIGESYVLERNWELAIQNFLQAEKLLRPDESAIKGDLSIEMGKAYLELKPPKTAEAIQKLEAGREAAPNNPEIPVALAKAYLKERKDEKALTAADQMIKSKQFEKLAKQQRVDLLLISGKALYNQKKQRESRERFARAYEIDKTDVEVKKQYVYALEFQAYQAFDKKDYKEAGELLDLAATVDEKASGIHQNRAVMLIAQRQCDQARVPLEKMKRGYLYDRLMARTYLCSSRPNKKKAAEHFARADAEVKKVADNLLQAEIYIEWAPIIIESGGSLNDAVEKLQDAVQFTTGPDNKKLNEAAKRNLAVALFRRGWQLLKAGKSSEAASDFERANREPSLLKGTEPLAFEFSHALALLDKGDANEAARMFKALGGKGNQKAYLKAPYDKVGSQFFAAYASYRSGTPEKRAQAASEFAKLASAGGSFGAKIKDLLASSYEYVAYDHWRNGKEGAARKALNEGGKHAAGDIDRRIRHNEAVLSMSSKQLSTFRDLGASPPEALVNLGVLYDQQDKPKEAYEAWVRAKGQGANARDLQKWIDAKKRIYGFN